MAFAGAARSLNIGGFLPAIWILGTNADQGNRLANLKDGAASR